ncbi:MAG: LLM class flavin-dependent oxidoreductase [Acidimicrobiales bacterium]
MSAAPAPDGFTTPQHTGAAAAAVRRGVWMYPGAPAGALADAVIAADELGLDEVWIADEGVAREPFTVLAAAARQTRRVRLAIGITSPLLRHPGAIAATAATLDELSDGRAVLGLGVGGHESLEPFAIAAPRPVAILRDAIATARAVLSAADGPGYVAPGHAFGPRAVPIWVGARGPQLTRLAARVADGVFLSGCTAAQHVEIVERVRAISAVEIALYESAAADRSMTNTSGWDDVAAVLATEAARHAPTAIGINLVELSRPGADAVALVERAAAVLDTVAVA